VRGVRRFSIDETLRARYSVVPFDARYLDEVLSIEHASYTHPWRRSAFEYEIERNPLGWARVALSREDPPRVAAYLITWIVFEHLHVQNVAVHPEHRRRGLARFLLILAMEEALSRDATTVLLEVRRSNVGAQRVYLDLGFREAGERKDYYSSPREDAIVFRRELSPETMPR
jgi:[ribosomal protein S18]-alanine N-acetyltransferase